MFPQTAIRKRPRRNLEPLVSGVIMRRRSGRVPKEIMAVCDGQQEDGMLYRLTYVSDMLSSPELLDSSFQQILLQSYILNARDNITGFLITYGGWYAQAIEGPRAAVDACYTRIARDSRHANPEVRSRGLVGSRLFPQWSMCGLTLSARDAGVLDFAEQAFGLDLRSASPQKLSEFLIVMSRRYNDQATRRYENLRVV